MCADLLQHRLKRSAARWPDSTAVSHASAKISFRQLDSESNRLARVVRAQGLSDRGIGLIYLDRSVWSVVAMFGLLKADGVFVPVDPAAPAQRLLSMILSCRPDVIVCDSRTQGRIDSLFREIDSGAEFSRASSDESGHGLPVIVNVEKLPPSVSSPRGYSATPDDVCLVIFTSGSSGSPKGVKMTHRNLLSYIDWASDFFEISHCDVVLNTAPFHSDMSVFDIHCAIKCGSKLVIADKNDVLFPEKLLQLIEREGVSIWKGVTSLLSYVSQSGVLGDQRIPTLKKVVFSGEVLPPKIAGAWMSVFPEKEFFNAYGPTEATGISVIHRIDADSISAGSLVPIGRPCSNTDVILLAESGKETKDGDVGEICILGPCVSPGYLSEEKHVMTPFMFMKRDSNCEYNRAYLTGDFGRLNPKGDLEFIGRKDRQVKISGYRIELEGIEHILANIDEVYDAAVTVHGSEEASDRFLVAYLVCPRSDAETFCRQEISKRVAPNMMPRRITIVREIPRNSIGKVDWVALERIAGGSNA